MAVRKAQFDDGPVFTLDLKDGKYEWLYPDGTTTGIVRDSIESAERAAAFGLEPLSREYANKNREK